MTKEQEDFILSHNGEYSFAHMSAELCLPISEIQEFIKSCKKFKTRILYRNRSKEWKDEVADYLRGHSITKTCNYFCIAGSIVEKIQKEYDIELMNRSDTLKVSRIENFGSWESYKNSMIENTRKTSQERYGVDNYASTEEAKEKGIASCKERYGVANPMQSFEIKARFQDTNMQRRGVPWPQQDPEVLSKRLQTCAAKYGAVGWASQTIIDKCKATTLMKYGVEYDMQSPEVKRKVNETCLEKYGVMWPCLTTNCRTYIRDSGPNRAFAALLDSLDISYEKEYGISRYAYDFKVNNTLIEIDPAPTHNSTWGIMYDKPMDKTYHRRKSMLAETHGFRCLHVWDWDDKDKVLELLKPRETIYARNCCIESVDKQLEKEFLTQNHLQGYVHSDCCLGLFYNDVLISLMSFGKPRYNKNYEYELLRYSSSANITGGAERLFNHFVKNTSAVSVVSYCDRSKFIGTTYTKLGFNSAGVNIGKHWYNMKTSKHITDNLLRQRGFDQLLGKEYGCFGKGTSNEELMLQHDFVEIYDAGQETFVWKNS